MGIETILEIQGLPKYEDNKILISQDPAMNEPGSTRLHML